ncbi:MAG: nucleotidyl transferase AbiEii/AbiGii toxin family protein [Pseudomonadota bacterium]
MTPLFNERYLNQVKLLVQVLPLVAEQKCFALKGGTAINLFLRDMPRLSVDIDLMYLPVNDRLTAITEMENALKDIKKRILQIYPDIEVLENITQKGRLLSKLLVKQKYTQVIIEPNFILRGTLHPAKPYNLTQKAGRLLNMSVSNMPLLYPAEVYAGKCCAALDRQHPRDLFDIKMLYENDGLTKEIRQAFVVYLACAPRPMHELLDPNILDMQTTFQEELLGMTDIEVTYDQLLAIRTQLINDMRTLMTDKERQFLLSLKQGAPDYTLMPFKNLEQLPALQWKLVNIRKMGNTKHQQMVDKLKEVLNS